MKTEVLVLSGIGVTKHWNLNHSARVAQADSRQS